MPAGDDTTVESVTDGDTIRVADGVRVRLIGIDTPETVDPRTSVQCFGPEASARMKATLPTGTLVRLVYDVERLDRYGRTLAYVYRASDGDFVNAAMVRDGYASAYTEPPNVAHADEFVALQREARDANRGLWGACPVGAPAPAAPPPPASTGNCDPSYPDVCIPPAPPDLDCGDVAYRRFRVVGSDPHRFDADHDGVGCESG
jgi:micrococcal nuclease